MRLGKNWIFDGVGSGTPAPCRLMSGRVLRLERARGSVLCCLRGTAWITEDGSIADIVLEPGQRHVVERMGSVVVMGLPSCEIALRRATVPRAEVAWPWRRSRPVIATQPVITTQPVIATQPTVATQTGGATQPGCATPPDCCAPAERLLLV